MKVKGHWSACRDECFLIFFSGGGGWLFFLSFFICVVGKGVFLSAFFIPFFSGEEGHCAIKDFAS